MIATISEKKLLIGTILCCVSKQMLLKKAKTDFDFFKSICLDTQQSIVPISIFFSEIVAIIGYNSFYAQFFCHFYQTGVRHFLFFESMVLKLYIIIFTKQTFVELCRLVRSLFITTDKSLRSLTLNTCRQTNQTFIMLFNQFMVDSGFVIHSFAFSSRN